MRVTKLAASVLVLFAWTVLSAAPLRANGTDDFTYQAGGNTFSWQLPSNPNPSSSGAGYDFTFTNFSITENNSTVTGTLDFYSNAYGGGFDFWTGSLSDQDFLIDAYGSQLYWGSTGLPTLLTGNFWFLDFAGNDNNQCVPIYLGNLQVSSASSVPEPSALLLLLVGTLTALGISVLRRN
jgi:hypothetical protein